MDRPAQDRRSLSGLEKPARIPHRSLSLLLAVVIFMQASCSTPVRPENLAQPDKRFLGRIAILSARFEPDYHFEAFTSGKGEGAVKGAGAGAASCAELSRGASGDGGGIVVLLILACLPIGAAVGALHGAIQAAPAQQVEQVKISAQREIASLELNKKTMNAALLYSKAMGVELIPVETPLGPANRADFPSYSALNNQADSVIEISILNTKAFSPGQRKLTAWLSMEARIRVIGVIDGRVIDTLTIKEVTISRSVDEWLASDGRLIKAAFDAAAASIAEQAIDEILLVYHPRPIPQQQSEKNETSQTERVPSYALRTTYPPIRNKIDFKRMNYGHLERYQLSQVQPSFSWESWPRGFDIQSLGDLHPIVYDFRIFREDRLFYERRGIVEAEHKMEIPLQPCETYRWTVRARFKLNGVPRATEWTGAYDTMGGPVAPWWWRRGSGVPALAVIPDSVINFYPIIETPGLDGNKCQNR